MVWPLKELRHKNQGFSTVGQSVSITPYKYKQSKLELSNIVCYEEAPKSYRRELEQQGQSDAEAIIRQIWTYESVGCQEASNCISIDLNATEE